MVCCVVVVDLASNVIIYVTIQAKTTEILIHHKRVFWSFYRRVTLEMWCVESVVENPCLYTNRVFRCVLRDTLVRESALEMRGVGGGLKTLESVETLEMKTVKRGGCVVPYYGDAIPRGEPHI